MACVAGVSMEVVVRGVAVNPILSYELHLRIPDDGRQDLHTYQKITTVFSSCRGLILKYTKQC